MLQITCIFSAHDRVEFQKNFNPEKQTWIVSDLRSKFEIQNSLIKKYGFFEDTAVLRASELWKLILKRLDPDFQVVGNDFLKTWLSGFIENVEFFAAKNKSEDTVISILDACFQVVSHPQGSELMEDWFNQNHASKKRWGKWYEIASQAGTSLLEIKKISSKWVASFLCNHLNNQLSDQGDVNKYWNRDLIVDLGTDMTRSEAEIYRILSKKIDVHILEPRIVAEEKYSYIKKPYKELCDYTQKKNKSDLRAETHNQKSKNITLIRVTSPLSEVKYATTQVRNWIETGIHPENILVTSANIEDYWPLLQPYFSEEGIPQAKDTCARLHSFPQVMRWLSRLKIATRNFEYPNIEMSVFDKQALDIRFEKFKAMFKNLLDETDLLRDRKIYETLLADKIPQTPLSAEQILIVMAQFWIQENITYLEVVMRALLESSDSNLKLKFNAWVFWIEQICAHKEVVIKAGARDGVQILNIQSADSSKYSHRIFLNLTESAYKSKNLKLISSSEVERIMLDLGFQFPHPEIYSLNYELEWLLQNSKTESHLCFPMSNIESAIEAPHPQWLKYQVQDDQNSISTYVPSGTRMDALQNLKDYNQLLAEKKWTSEAFMLMEGRIQTDLGDKELPLITNAKINHMSASQLETFFDCSFKFAANKIFFLQDPVEADINPDLRSKGQLIHSLFDRLSREPRRYNYSDEELRTILEEIKNPINSLGDNSLWPSLRENILKLGKRFLSYEQETASSRKKTIAQELKFKKEALEFEWVGSVDRIDLSIDNSIVLYDYKNKNDQYDYKNWLKKNHLQLGLYAWLLTLDKPNMPDELKSGLSRLTDQKHDEIKISKALYYVYKDFKMCGADLKDLENFYPEIESKINFFKEKFYVGDFKSKPSDVSHCEYCPWSRLCRATHLNQ